MHMEMEANRKKPVESIIYYIYLIKQIGFAMVIYFPSYANFDIVAEDASRNSTLSNQYAVKQFPDFMANKSSAKK